MGQKRQSNVIDFAAYRAAHPRPQPLLPFGLGPARTLPIRDAAHRERMLQHLTDALRFSRSGAAPTVAEIATLARN